MIQQPSALESTTVNLYLSVPGRSFLSFGGKIMLENACTNLTMVYDTSIKAKSWPRRPLGPPLKGKYAHRIYWDLLLNAPYEIVGVCSVNVFSPCLDKLRENYEFASANEYWRLPVWSAAPR